MLAKKSIVGCEKIGFDLLLLALIGFVWVRFLLVVKHCKLLYCKSLRLNLVVEIGFVFHFFYFLGAGGSPFRKLALSIKLGLDWVWIGFAFFVGLGV